MSGSCQLKTCWKSAPEFRVIGKALKHLFKKAILVDQSNIGNGELLIPAHRKAMRKYNQYHSNDGRKKYHKNRMLNKQKFESSLLYYERSPNFCERDARADIQGSFCLCKRTLLIFILFGFLFFFLFLGTTGRKCNRTGTGMGSCSTMCCGRGYNLIKERRIEKCFCKFHWCCEVKCQECPIEEWISVCK